MEKLELKHIVGYLPYGLKVKTGNGKLIRTLNIEIDENSRYIISLNNLITGIGYKPILRPLSDLTKEIEVNGKSFVPAEYFWSVDDHEQQLFELYGTLPFYWKACLEVDIRDWEWGVVQKLYEWHFDIHRLIEKGLAIDLNTIENGIQ